VCIVRSLDWQPEGKEQEQFFNMGRLFRSNGNRDPEDACPSDRCTGTDGQEPKTLHRAQAKTWFLDELRGIKKEHEVCKVVGGYLECVETDMLSRRGKTRLGV